MQSYTDLIVLAIIAGALLLLMLLLAFFILLHRRISVLEDANEALSSDLTALKLKLSELNNDTAAKTGRLRQENEQLTKRLSALEAQQTFLQKTQDECIDALNELKDKQSSLKAEQEVQQLLIDKHSDPEHETLQQAKELLAQGAALEKVQQITGMPVSELEMLKSVQDSRRRRADAVLASKAEDGIEAEVKDAAAPAAAAAEHAPEAPRSAHAAHSQGSAMQLSDTHEGGTLSVSPAVQAGAAEDSAAAAAFEHIPEVRAEPARPIASWKAREAYGMKSLRSRR